MSLRSSTGSVNLAPRPRSRRRRSWNGASPIERPLMSLARTKPAAGRAAVAADDRHGRARRRRRPAASAPTSSRAGVGIDGQRRADLARRGASAKAPTASPPSPSESQATPPKVVDWAALSMASASAAIVGRRTGAARARRGASRLRSASVGAAPDWAPSAVATSATGRLASAGDADRAGAPSPPLRASCGAEAQPLSTTMRSGPVPGATVDASAEDRSGEGEDDRGGEAGSAARSATTGCAPAALPRAGRSRGGAASAGTPRSAASAASGAGGTRSTGSATSGDEHRRIGEGEGQAGHAARPPRSGLERAWRSASRAWSGKQRLGRRPVGAVDEERPVEPAADAARGARGARPAAPGSRRGTARRVRATWRAPVSGIAELGAAG